MRTVARGLGYALGLHGSIARDVDLIATPWAEDAADAETLIAALMEHLATRHSQVFLNPPLPTIKPHGRRAWSIFIHNGVYFDVSVMPRVAPPP